MYRISIATNEHRSFMLEREDIICLLEEGDSKLIESVDVSRNTVNTGYYVGLSRICKGEGKLHIAPKIASLDYMGMLSVILDHPHVSGYTNNLFRADMDSPPISCNEDADMITPLIVVEYLRVLKRIVQRGLVKSYYRVQTNRHSSVKGKIMVVKSISKNQLQNKTLYNWCSHDEFGIDNPSNRLLKYAQSIISRSHHSKLLNGLSLAPAMAYIRPAFDMVGEIDIGDAGSQLKANSFYSDYPEALRLARIIIRRLGYSSRSGIQESFNVPPYWIDMSKLFELYVLAKLQEALPVDEIIFQAQGKYGQVDFLGKGTDREMIIDAKYKSCYARGEYDIENIRQLSGYARDTGLLRRLGGGKGINEKVLPCLIIYPDRNAPEDLDAAMLLEYPIIQFEKFYKVGISLPILSKKT